MKNFLCVPVWLRSYLKARGLGLEVLLSDSPGDILSKYDVEAYRTAQEIIQAIPEHINPIHGVAVFFNTYTRSLLWTVDFSKPAPNEIEGFFNRISKATGTLYDPTSPTALSEVFYQFMVTGVSAGFRGNEGVDHPTLAREVIFDFQYIGDTMVVLADHAPGSNNREPKVRAEILNNCIDKMHLFMSFEEIASTQIFQSYIEVVGRENALIRGRAGNA